MSGIEKFRIALIKQLSNIPGWRTKKKIVIFESDDWGAIRTPSLEVFKKLSENNISVFDPFSNYDSLESQTDLEQLFNVLRSIKDINGHYPVFSANCVVSNPDFEKIAKSGFKEYHYEMVTETFKKYPNHKSSFKLWQEGLNEHIFYPQYHGREHINPSQWLKLLNAGNQAYRYAFMLNTYSVNSREEGSKRNNLLATLDFDNEYQKQQVQKALLEGLSIFNSLFGFKSNSFTPPCYIWDKETENLLAQNGIKFIKTSRTQSIPNPGGGGYFKKYHYTGEKNSFNQFYQVRNCLFEPSLKPNINWVKACLNSIDVAFKWHKPAIISSHRLNYIGSINESNRSNNITLLKELLQTIVLRWPDVEFLNSKQLGELILNNE